MTTPFLLAKCWIDLKNAPPMKVAKLAADSRRSARVGIPGS